MKPSLCVYPILLKTPCQQNKMNLADLFIYFDKVVADFEAWLVKKNKLLDTTHQRQSQRGEGARLQDKIENNINMRNTY